MEKGKERNTKPRTIQTLTFKHKPLQSSQRQNGNPEILNFIPHF